MAKFLFFSQIGDSSYQDSFEISILSRRKIKAEFIVLITYRLLRIETTLQVRQMRGFIFVKGIDDQMTECGLDEYTDWDIILTNDIQIVDGILPLNLDECLTRLCSEIHQLLLSAK